MKTIGWKNVIYEKMSELPEDCGTYDNKDWIEKQEHRIKNFEKEIDLAIERNKDLIEAVSVKNKNNITIVDLGGGYGLSYFPLRKSLELKDIIYQYNIVECKNVARSAKEFFLNNQELIFHDVIPQKENIDIFYIRSSLQYVKDWKETVMKITSLSPETIVFSHLAAGQIPNSYLTIQLWGDQEIPYWVINEEEMCKIFTNSGYKISSRKISEDITKNKIWESFRNLPARYQIDNTISLKFDKII
jgi:putative methyltransferase (TIGR04325 family)